MLVGGLAADGFDVERDDAHDALDRRTQFNAIGADALKVDFMIRKRRPFSVAEFERRQPADLLATAGFAASAEDPVVAKLEWATESESDVQLRDVAGILAVSGDAIDVVYPRKWIDALQLEAIWDRTRSRRPGRRKVGDRFW